MFLIGSIYIPPFLKYIYSHEKKRNFLKERLKISFSLNTNITRKKNSRKQFSFYEYYTDTKSLFLRSPHPLRSRDARSREEGRGAAHFTVKETHRSYPRSGEAASTRISSSYRHLEAHTHCVTGRDYSFSSRCVRGVS